MNKRIGGKMKDLKKVYGKKVYENAASPHEAYFKEVMAQRRHKERDLVKGTVGQAVLTSITR
jgi:hypothetical protein